MTVVNARKISPKALLLATLILAACGGGKHGDTSSEAGPFAGDGGLGFYSVATPGLPPGIAAAGDSVFELRIIGNDNGTREDVDVSNGKGAKLKKRILHFPASRADSNAKIVMIKQIEFCEAQAIEHQKACPLYWVSHQASGFVTGDGSTLWTAAHAIEPFLDIVENEQQVSKKKQFAKHQRVGVFVFNNIGQLVIDPFAEAIRLERAPRLTYVAKAFHSYYAQDSDYVTLQLPRAIGKPLHVSAAKPVPGQKIFILGYPVCTGCKLPPGSEGDGIDMADRSPAPNSEGRGLKVTFGRVIPVESLPEILGAKAETLRLWELQWMVISNADSQAGQSGGPILNEAGEVVAVHAGGKSRRVNGALTRMSRGSFPAILLP